MNLNGIGKDQWIKYGFGGNPTRVNDKDNLEVTLTKKVQKEVGFTQACKDVAEELYELNKGKTIFIPMSGGCDSETVANSFYKLKIPFTPIIHELWYMGLQTSYADTWWATRWCAERKIKPVYKNNSVMEMFAENKPYIDKIKGRKLYPVQNVTLAEYAKEHDGIVINGQAFMEYYPEKTLDYLKDLFVDTSFFNPDGSVKTGWMLHEDDFYIDMYDPGYHTYNFLSWTPEIALAYITERDMTKNSEDNKFKIMGCSPRPKLAAPDFVWTFLAEYQRKLKRKYGTSEVAWLGTHEEMLEMLR